MRTARAVAPATLLLMLCGYALIPLDIAAHLAHNPFHLLAEGGTVVTTLAALLGLGVACSCSRWRTGCDAAPRRRTCMRTPSWTSAAVATAVALTLSACSAGAPEESISADGLPVVPPSAGHVHGVAVNPADDKVYLGTHGGTMVVEDDAVQRVGDATIDLMGFAVAGPDHFYASGHPGPNDRYPNPVGLIESKDAGRTWSQLSLGGVSDFHTLTAAGGAVHGFDGVMKSTTDGRTWTDGARDVAPASIGVHPETPATVLATTEHGLVRSTDGGKTFTDADDAPVLVFLAWVAPDALWAVDPAGGVHLSADGGVTWKERGGVGRPPQAFTAADEQTVVVVLADAIVRSGDGGATFEKIAARS